MDWIAYILILVLFIIMCTGFVYLNKKIIKPIIINHIAGTSEFYTEDDKQQEQQPQEITPPPQYQQTSFENKKSPERQVSSAPAVETKSKTTPLEISSGTTPLEPAKGTTLLQF